MQKDLSNHSINDPPLLKRKRECKRWHDEHLARTILRSQQIRQRKGQQFEGIEEFDYAIDPKTGRMFYKESRRNLPTASSSSSKSDQTHWKTSNWNSQHSSRSDELWFFSEFGPVSVAWRKTSRQPTGGMNSTPTNTGRTELHSMIAFSSREHAWLKSWTAQDCTSLCPETIVIHESMSRSLPRLTLSTGTSSLTYLTYFSNDLSNPHKTCWYTMNIYRAVFHGRVADQHKSHLSQCCVVRCCVDFLNVPMADCVVRNCQVESVAGAAHLPIDNSGVSRWTEWRWTEISFGLKGKTACLIFRACWHSYLLVETHFGGVETHCERHVETYFGSACVVCRRRWQTGWLRALCSMVRGEIHGFVEGELPRKHITSNQSSKDGQINRSFLILRVVVRGRSQLVKWFASFISVRTGT